MDYEKAYKEALERARNYYSTTDSVADAELIELIFPELNKESEDEKIRKEIILVFKHANHKGIYNKHLAWLEKQGENNNQYWKPSKEQISALEHFIRSVGESGYASLYDNNTKLIFSLINDLYTLEKLDEKETFCDKCRKEHLSHSCQDITELGRCYLEHEKQGEQKPIIDGILTATNYDKMFQNCNVPRFKVGDWIVRGDTIAQILDIQEQYYVGLDINGKDFTSSRFLNDAKIHLWTIQDAKDGDVLSYVTDEENLWIMIYWSLYEPYEGHVHYHALLVNDNFSDKGTCCICINDLKPATLEQRNLLFSKMKEAGYEWDEETNCLYKRTPNNLQITIGTKIRLKTNPNVILSIISDDCHEDEFECSNGSVLSLKQIEKYYDIIT